jgi:hypothetical protein
MTSEEPIMNGFAIITAAAFAATFGLTAASTTQASTYVNGMNMQGTSAQGMTMQGTSLQGNGQEGKSLNGRFLNGFGPEGAAVMAVTLPSGETVVLR